MQILIFIIYLAFFAWLVSRLPFNRKTNLVPWLLSCLFIYRVLVGCLYGWVHSLQPDYQTTMDTWKFYSDGLNETKLLYSNPAAFFKELLRNPYEDGFGKFFSTSNSYWNDLKHNVMIKFAGLLNVLSNGNYYTNIIFYNFLAFFGPVALYRTAISIRGVEKMILIFICFLLPTTAFWTSGFHKEGLLLMAICLIIFYTQKGIQTGWNLRNALMILFCFGLIFMLRNNVIFALAPAWLLWLTGNKFKKKIPQVFAAGLVFFIAVFFGSKYLVPKLDLPESVRQRQIEFMALRGNTYVAMDTLKPSLPGFIKHFPAAADMAFLRPHPAEGGIFYIPFTLESILIIGLILMAIFKPRKEISDGAFIYFCFCYAISLMMLIGYTITNTGTIIRYRSLAVPFFILALSLIIRWEPGRKKTRITFNN